LPRLWRFSAKSESLVLADQMGSTQGMAFKRFGILGILMLVGCGDAEGGPGSPGGELVGGDGDAAPGDGDTDVQDGMGMPDDADGSGGGDGMNPVEQGIDTGSGGLGAVVGGGSGGGSMTGDGDGNTPVPEGPGGAGGSLGMGDMSECNENGAKDGLEEGVDCGLRACGIPCSGVTSCELDTDCSTDLCHRGLCAAPISGVHLTGLSLKDTEHPYVLIDGLQVAQTFSIGPGVRLLNGASHRVRANGPLEFLGTAGAPIEIAQVQFDLGGGDSNEAADITVTHTEFSGGGLLSSGGTGYKFGAISIRDSRFEGAGALDVHYPTGGVEILRNVFFESGELGLGLQGNGSFLVENNLFHTVDASLYDSAIRLWASYDGATLVVSKNSFLNLGGIFALRLEGDGTTMDASSNYFGTTVQSEVNAMVYDQNDNIDVGGIIDVDPLLVAPDGATPAL